jgi:hypothetical protein
LCRLSGCPYRIFLHLARDANQPKLSKGSRDSADIMATHSGGDGYPGWVWKAVADRVSGGRDHSCGEIILISDFIVKIACFFFF